MSTLRPFLLFEGKAEEAMRFYTSIFPASSIEEIQRYDSEGPGKAGTVARATFTVAGQSVFCTDSPISHPFTFTPAFSFFFVCDSEEQLRQLHTALGQGGAELMPLDNYGFSRLFTWISDRYGISWQLNLP
jgi:predicted 3-demethylubiquinone-9 3-methyltransferase (glyoxalase superfamily)